MAGVTSPLQTPAPVHFLAHRPLTHAKFLPVVPGYSMLSLSRWSGPMMNTARAVAGLLSKRGSSGSIMPSFLASCRSSSEMMGNGNGQEPSPLYERMSSIQVLCDWTGSQDIFFFFLEI